MPVLCRHLNLLDLQKSNSTGVARPKMVTITFSVFLSRFTSSTTPLKARERSFVDPHLLALLEHVKLGLGFSAAVFTCVRI